MNTNDNDDNQMMLRAREGDMVAFEKIIERHQNMIFGTAAKMLGSLSAAEDIAQMVFVRAWQSAHRYEPTAKVSTWLLTITRNLVFNEMRSQQRRPTSSLDAEEGAIADTHPDDMQRTPSEILRERELRAAVDKAIAALPEKMRMAVILRRYEDMPYEDITKVLDISLSALKTLLFRARGILKDSLVSYLD